MNFFIRQKVVIWILSGILIVTVSVLGSVFYFNWKSRVAPEPVTGCSSSCQMMTAELDLSSSQNFRLEEILGRYHDTSAMLVNALRQSRLDLMEELRKEHPDTARIRLLTSEIGNTQARMTGLAANQYLQIRTICDSSQREKLNNFYCDMFGCPRAGWKEGDSCAKQSQHRNRHGKE